MAPYPKARSPILFSLKPANKQAQEVVDNPNNRHLTSKLDGQSLVIDVGNQKSDEDDIIATIGRGVHAHIFVDDARISRIQCYFRIVRESNEIMLHDNSKRKDTHVSGVNEMPFEKGRPRQVVIRKELNTVLGIGGEAPGTIKFEIIWHGDPTETAEKINNRYASNGAYKCAPRLARTVSDLETMLPSHIPTMAQTPGQGQLRLRYIAMDELGHGKFGTVKKCLDVDTGRFRAVKILRQPDRISKEPDRRSWLQCALKREIEALSLIDRPHVIDYVTSQGWEGPSIEIFMGLKDGDLASLILNDNPQIAHPSTFASDVFFQILQALDYLTVNGIVHRDVKPANILYSLDADGKYHFQLGDFGLSNRTLIATSSVGSPLFMAPELLSQGETQTSKVDIWSLYVTMIWILDIKDFRSRSEHLKSHEEIRQAVLDTRSARTIIGINEMVRPVPLERASAAQMLVKIYAGEGLTTPRNSVPPIAPTAEEATAPDTIIPSLIKPVRQLNDAKVRTTRKQGGFRTRRANEAWRFASAKRVAALKDFQDKLWPDKCHGLGKSPLPSSMNLSQS